MPVMNSKFEKDGKSFEVRFFDEDSIHDLHGLKKIVETPSVKRYMAQVHGMRHRDLKLWMSEHGKHNEFLFAVCEAKEAGDIYGFIYIYPSEIERHALDVSYAKCSDAPSGLISPALVEVCKLVKRYIVALRPHKRSLPKILAEIEEENVPSIKTIEKAGFEMVRKFDEDDNGIWQLNWENVS